MHDSAVFNREADSIVEVADKLIRKTERSGMQWRDRKYRELCDAMKEIKSGEDSLRSAASACAGSVDAFWNIAAEQV